MNNVEEEYFSADETDCSVPCGPGVSMVISVTCQKSCFPDCCKRTFEETPCQITKCNVTFSPWSDWSECSKPCVSSIEERSVKRRTRTCTSCSDEIDGKFQTFALTKV